MGRRNASSPFWMTCTPLLMCQTERVHCMTAWEQSCTHKRGFACTLGRQECVTERHCVLQGLLSWDRKKNPRRRENLANAFGFTFKGLPTNDWQKNRGCGTLSQRCRICRQRGRSSCSAQARGATTCCEHCHHQSPKCTPEDNDSGMERVMRTLLALLATTKKWSTTSHQCPCGEVSFGTGTQNCTKSLLGIMG